MDLIAIGINFKTAPVEVREQVSFSATDVPSVLNRLRQALPDAELVLLSTCNRTELYVAGQKQSVSPEQLVRLLAGKDGVAEYFHAQESTAAIMHLLTVASSLDSMVVGETEILGQVKQAYNLAVEAGTAGPILMPLFQRAFQVAKRVRAETDISRGRVSVASIAVELTERVFETLHTKTVMVVGAGEMSEQTLKSLVVDKGVKEALVLNRSLERGRALADRYGGTALQFDRLEEYLPRADIIISSTGAPHCVIRAGPVRNAMAERHERPVLIIDLAVPRDVEAEVGLVDNVYLYNIDDLQRVADENLERRQAAMTIAQRIVTEEADAAALLLNRRQLGLVMKKLDEAARQIEESELDRLFAKDKVAPFPAECERCREEIRIMVHRAMNKMLAEPKKTLNESAKNENHEDFLQLVKRLFGIKDDDRDDK